MGGVAGWWCKPERAREDCAIIYFHGGAYVLGSAAAYRNFAGQIAKRAGAAIFIVDYHRAPERTFPAPVNDAEAAYRSLSASGFSKLAIAGDSAGGGLALALLLLVTAASKDGSAPQPACAAVMSPWTDLALTGKSMETRAKADPMLTRDALEIAAALYLGDHDRRDPRASPLYGDFTSVPPVLFHVGEDEILLDDSHRVAELMDAAGGLAQLQHRGGNDACLSFQLCIASGRRGAGQHGEFLAAPFLTMKQRCVAPGKSARSAGRPLRNSWFTQTGKHSSRTASAENAH